MLYLFVISVVNPFIDIIWTFFRHHLVLHYFLCLILFEITFLIKFFTLWTKSVFFTKSVISGISVLLDKFACAYAQQIFWYQLIKFLSSIIFIMIMISSHFLFNFISFCVMVSFLTKSLASVVLIFFFN